MNPQNDSNKKKDDERKGIFLLALLLFLGSGFFLYLAFLNRSESESTSLNPADQVNFNLQKTIQKQELDRLKLQNEHFSKFRSLDPRSVKKNTENDSLHLEYDRTHERVADDLKGAGSNQASIDYVEDAVQSQVFNDLMAREQNEKRRQEYARQFIENARRGGYEVKLTSDYRIRSVRRIAPPGHLSNPPRSRSSATQ